jgi:hypothetical protein
MTELPYDLITAQHGLVTTDQLAEAGVLLSDQLAPLSGRVLRLRGAPETTTQRVLAAILDAGPGAALSHSSALAWWLVPGFDLRTLHISVPRARSRPIAGGVLHHVDVPDRHVKIRDSVPVVTPTRALFDLAGMDGMPPKRVERAIDNAWSLHLVSGRTLRRMLREVGAKGRPGIGTMRELLKDRGLDYIPPASGLEGRVVEVLKGRGVTLRRQVDTGDDETWIARVDFADTELPFRLEVQSERFHASLVDTRADRERLGKLEAAGFVTVTVTDTDVWHYPEVVVDRVREGRYKANVRRLRAAG